MSITPIVPSAALSGLPSGIWSGTQGLPVLPYLPGQDVAVSKGMVWNTEVIQSANGKERRTQYWPYPLWNFSLQYGVIRHRPTNAELFALWEFFGVLQGSGVAGNRLFQVAMGRRLSPAVYERLSANAFYRGIARGLTFAWFAFTLRWFWSDWADIGALGRTLGWAGSSVAVIGTIATASLVLALPDAAGGITARIAALMRSRYTRTAFASAMLLAIAISGLVLKLSSPEIVYKQF